uniref:M96 mating-specific protein family n=1 Tax=Phytophthora ramorum TaxID=164328 RepID=H3HDS2_PHYRM
MAFLEDEDDVRVLEAALGFVDECSAEIALPSATQSFPVALSGSELLPRSNVSGASTSSEAPSFMVDCQEMSMMVPVKMTKTLHINAESAGFQLRSPSAITQKTKKANPNRARDEAQFELVYMREKVSELEKKLRSLQLNGWTMRHTTVPPASQDTLSRMPRVWEEMAKRQKRRRDQAEYKNAHFKVLFERQQKMTLTLREALRKRLNQQDFHGDIGDFQDLFQRLEAAYEDLDSVFAANGLSNVQIPTTNIHVRKGDDDKHVEIFSSKLLPFSLQDTGEAAWDHFKGIEKHLGNGGLYGKSVKNLEQPFTIFEDFTKEVFSNNSRADVQAKQIVRRCVEPDRDLILFVSTLTPVEIKHKAIDGLVYSAREYALTKRMPGSTAGDELSLLQLCTCISFECEPGVTFDNQYIRSVAQFWIGNIVGNVRCYQERVSRNFKKKWR